VAAGDSSPRTSGRDRPLRVGSDHRESPRVYTEGPRGPFRRLIGSCRVGCRLYLAGSGRGSNLGWVHSAAPPGDLRRRSRYRWAIEPGHTLTIEKLFRTEEAAAIEASPAPTTGHRASPGAGPSRGYRRCRCRGHRIAAVSEGSSAASTVPSSVNKWSYGVLAMMRKRRSYIVVVTLAGSGTGSGRGGPAFPPELIIANRRFRLGTGPALGNLAVPGDEAGNRQHATDPREHGSDDEQLGDLLVREVRS
jgi:hypothetical protein